MRNAAWFTRMQALAKRCSELQTDVEKALVDDKQESDGLYEANECLQEAYAMLSHEIDRTFHDMNRK